MKLDKQMEEELTRPLSDTFFEKAGTYNGEEAAKLFKNILKEYQPLAYIIIKLAFYYPDVDCITARHLLYKTVKDASDNDGTDFFLPYYWYVDGVMIEPEFIVRITNGIIGWKCDNSYKSCGMKGKCRYYPKE